MENSVMYKIADKSEQTGGEWSIRKSSTGIGIDPRIGQVCIAPFIFCYCTAVPDP